MGIYSVDKLMSEARKLAAEYRRATGQPLAISGEIAKNDAVQLLGLEAVTDPQLGYDALGKAGDREGLRILVKGRAIFDEAKGGQRLGQLKLDKPWDSVVLVLMNEDFEPFEIYEADRDTIEAAMEDNSSNRSKRGAMSVAKFKAIGQMVWNSEEGLIDDEVWDNQNSE